jgi:hypothetical protein
VTRNSGEEDVTDGTRLMHQHDPTDRQSAFDDRSLEVLRRPTFERIFFKARMRAIGPSGRDRGSGAGG